MPSRLRARAAIPVDRLELDGEDWVRVRRWLNAEDRDEINGRLTEINEKDQTGRFKTELINRSTALQALVEWGGPGLCVDDHHDAEGRPLDMEPGHEHKPVPITLESVSLLHSDDLNKIIAHVNAKNPRPVAPESNGPFREATPAGVS